jgi:hypothetical protein
MRDVARKAELFVEASTLSWPRWSASCRSRRQKRSTTAMQMNSQHSEISVSKPTVDSALLKRLLCALYRNRLSTSDFLKADQISHPS